MARRCGEKHIFNKNAPLATGSDHFLKLRCGKIARRCGEKCNFSTSQLQKLVRTCGERRILIENVLLATAACNFSTSQLQKVVRECCVLYILTCKCVARSTFGSQNRKKLTVSEHFLKFRCRKIARRCGEKHICKSKCTKYLCFAALFEVQMSKD